MLLRLVHKVDFEGLMAAPTWSRSTHFALHHLPKLPAKRRSPSAKTLEEMLSTGLDMSISKTVDNSNVPDAVWFGVVVPKRHARRAVTRTLVKRQIRAAFERHASVLPQGLWLVRLRRPLPATEFPSARSTALAAAARHELDELLACPAVPRHGKPPAQGSARRGR